MLSNIYTRCPYCQRLLPHWEKLADKKNNEEERKVIIVSVDFSPLMSIKYAFLEVRFVQVGIAKVDCITSRARGTCRAQVQILSP